MRKVLASSMIGNGFEWYDFALYGQLAYLLGQHFFPASDPLAQSMATFAAFAVAFIFRPLGALLFGWVGDKYGRKLALFWSIMLMAIPTGLIGILPTYAEIGFWAPLLLVLIRICQGISLGGEFGGAMTYVVEHSEGHTRGHLGATTMTSLIVGFMAGSLVVLLARFAIPEAEFNAWGWRIPFLLGILIGVAGMIIRRQCDESPVYLAAQSDHLRELNPLMTLWSEHKLLILQAMLTYAAATMPFYFVAIYLINFSQVYLQLPLSLVFEINLLSLCTMLLGVIASGHLSDQFGRRNTLLGALGLMILFGTTAILLMSPSQTTSALVAQLLLGGVVGLYLGPIPAYLVEIFPTAVRYTGMSIAFNLATVLFGGTTPLICVYLLSLSGDASLIAGYWFFCCTLAVIALWVYQDRWDRPLH